MRRLRENPRITEFGCDIHQAGSLLAIDLPLGTRSRFLDEIERSGVRVPADGVFRLRGVWESDKIERIEQAVITSLRQSWGEDSQGKTRVGLPKAAIEKTMRTPSRGFRFTEVDTPNSLSERFRDKRFEGLMKRARQFTHRPVRIIDLGGTVDYWVSRGLAGSPDYEITLVNLSPQPNAVSNIHFRMGDVVDLSSWPDQSFDIAVCHSVIEHLYTWDRQKKLVEELKRVARAYWVQTPNLWFPIEPHFLLPLFHWLPESLRIQILSRFGSLRCGPYRDLPMSRQAVQEIRLLSRKHLRTLFPESEVVPERVLGWVKSWVVTNLRENGPE